MGKVCLSILSLVAIALVGCGSSSSTTSEYWGPFHIPIGQSSVRYENELHPAASGLMGRELKPVMPKDPPPGFLAEAQEFEGIGHISHPGSRLTVQYVGVDFETGKKFASSWDEGKPFTFTLGKGEVIEGWEKALDGAEVGDRTEIVVPPELTKGPFPRDIPKDSTAIFVVELLRSEYPTEVEEREAEAKS